MNKSLKVISSVALAGMLAIHVATPKTLAATNDKFVGTYNKMAQFVLADASQQVTCRDIANSGRFTNITKFNGGNFNNDNTPVKTGQSFTADGKDYTVVVYGDVNGDGAVTPKDATEVLKSYTGTPLSGAKAEAANVARSNSNHLNHINPSDAANILKFYTGSQLLDGELQHDNVVPVEEDENFTIVLDGGYANFNNVNITDPQFKIKVEKRLEADRENLALKIDGVDNTGTAVTLTSTAKGDFTTNLNELTLDFDTPTTIKNIVGTATISLIDTDNNNKVIRTAKIENKAADIDIANIRTNRINSTQAKISFEGMGKYDVKNVYYTIGTSAPANPTKESEKINNVVNNKVTDVELKGLTVAGVHSQYTVKMLVEDIYGNLSSSNATPKYATATVVTEEEQANPEAKVKVVLDEAQLTATTPKVHFDIKKQNDTPNDKSLKVILYKNNKILSEKPITANNSDEQVVEFVSSDLDGVGLYKVSVIATGNGSTTSDSEATEATFEVKKLNPISNITIAENKTTHKLAINWNKSSEENVKGYAIDIYEIDANGKVATSPVGKGISQLTPSKNTESDNTVDINTSTTSASSKLDLDKAYVAKIVSQSKNILFVDSEATTSNQVVLLSTSSLDLGTPTTTSNSITFTPTGTKTVPGVTASYTLKVYNDNGANLGLAARYTPLKEINGMDANGKIVVDNLLPGTAYGFDLIEKIGNVENITSTIQGSILSVSTKVQAPVVHGLTVATYEAGKTASDYVGKIAHDSTNHNIYINGSVYSTNSGDYATEVTPMAAMVDTLEDGDNITIDGNVVTLNLVNNTQTRAFAATLEGKELVVNCNNQVEKTLTATSGKAPTKVTLNGTGALYTVSGLNADVTVSTGVKNITAGATQKVTLLPNVSTTINAVKVSTKAGTVVEVDAQDVTVHVEESKTDSELSFENNKDILFVTTNTSNKTTLSGTIKINTTEAVTIASTGVAVDSNILVISASKVVASEVAKTIDLTAITGLNGTKTVTVNKNAKSTVTFYSKTPAPKKGDGTQKVTKAATTVTLRQNYINHAGEADDQIAELVDAELISNRNDVNEVTAVTNYLKSFGINDENAKLTLEANNKVTITFANGATNTVTIDNIR